MIEYLHDNKIRLTPDQPRKRRPYSQLNSVERAVVDSLKDTMIREIRGQRFLQRQVARSNRYHRALAGRNWSKSSGLAGFVCGPEGCKVLRRI